MIVVHAFGASLLHERGGGVGVWLREAKNDASVHRLIFVTSEHCVQVVSVLLPVTLHYIETTHTSLLSRTRDDCYPWPSFHSSFLSTGSFETNRYLASQFSLACQLA